MTQPQINQKPRCEYPRCLEGCRKFGTEKFDAMTDDFLTTFIENMEEMVAKGQLKPVKKVGEPKVKIVGDVPTGLESIIQAAISKISSEKIYQKKISALLKDFKRENLPKEDISFAEKYRLASIRKSTKDFDPEEDVWDEEDTLDDEPEPEWLKQETPEQLQQQFDQAEAEDISSLLTLVEAMKQQLYAAKRMNDATLSILEVLSSQL
jgi:hypothetical protein